MNLFAKGMQCNRSHPLQNQLLNLILIRWQTLAIDLKIRNLTFDPSIMCRGVAFAAAQQKVLKVQRDPALPVKFAYKAYAAQKDAYNNLFSRLTEW